MPGNKSTIKKMRKGGMAKKPMGMAGGGTVKKAKGMKKGGTVKKAKSGNMTVADLRKKAREMGYKVTKMA